MTVERYLVLYDFYSKLSTNRDALSEQETGQVRQRSIGTLVMTVYVASVVFSVV
jgi:hypothetical protein